MKASDLYRRIWTKAYDEGEVCLRFKTEVEQRRMRLNLYAGVQKYRKDPLLDPDFSAMLDDLELTTTEAGGEYLIYLRRKARNPLLQDVARQLDGLMDSDPSDPT